MAKINLKSKKIFQLLLVVMILALGIVSFKFLSSLKKEPAKKERIAVAPLLNAMKAHPEELQMEIESFGTVQPKVQVQIIPQVSGKVVACHDNFVNGGFFQAGQTLVKIDPVDFELAVQNAEATVASAQVRLEQEQAEAKVAAEEWAQLNEGQTPLSPLVLRQPQIRQAEAELKAAVAQLETAKLNLDRTNVSVPFNGRVSEESVDTGQYIMAGQSIATVYGTDAVEIVVPLEDSELEWFDVPTTFNNGGNGKHNPGSKVIVTANFAGSFHTWTGFVVRTEGSIDESSRMVKVVVEVKDPFKLSDGRPPLTPGMFTDVKILGNKLSSVFRVPRYVVHNNDEVWVEQEGQLNIKKVNIIRLDTKYAYIESGLEDGDVVVTSPLDTVTDKMNIRVNIASQDESEISG
ncbi:MAG: efflux RND transporter periplasmic adaptor subunit [Sedimentisphaerales bacterium]|nr:efflux RND transporter periplasmic adaptor subunit [Sedimentisphaerales bacterium]